MEYCTVQHGVPKFWRNKYEGEAAKYWHDFYKRNSTNFYKDRHWLVDDAKDGFSCLAESQGGIVLEAGCGAANAIFPLMDVNPSLKVYAFDFARSAIDLVRASPSYDERKCTAFVWDFARMELEEVDEGERGGLSQQSVDFALCLFVLSAVPPELQKAAVLRLASSLKPGGKLLLRDYCVSDMAETRFRESSRMGDHYFVRQDGTLSYFFDEDRVHAIMSSANLERVEMRRITRVVVNRKEEKEMHRVWLQAIYQRPPELRG